MRCNSLNKNLNGILTHKTLIYSFLLILFFTCSITAADSEYYADITIDVDSSGFVTIEGITNHPDILAQNSESYTSKEQSYWLINITKNNTFDYVYELTLPEYSEINFIKSTGQIRIQDENGRLKIKGFGVNESLSVVVQYTIIKSEYIQNNEIIIIISVIIGLTIIFLILIFIKKRVNKDTDNKGNSSVNYNIKGLSDRQ